MVNVACSVMGVLETNEERDDLARFYERNKRRFFAIAYRRLQNAEDAEDEVQEAFLRLSDKPAKFFSLPEEERVKLTNIIVRNVAVDMLRKKEKRTEEELTDDISLADDTFEDIVFESVSLNELKEFIGTLPKRRRDVIYVHCLLEFTLEETARKLGVSVTTVKNELRLGRQEITEYLERG